MSKHKIEDSVISLGELLKDSGPPIDLDKAIGRTAEKHVPVPPEHPTTEMELKRARTQLKKVAERSQKPRGPSGATK